MYMTSNVARLLYNSLQINCNPTRLIFARLSPDKNYGKWIILFYAFCIGYCTLCLMDTILFLKMLRNLKKINLLQKINNNIVNINTVCCKIN